MSKGKECTIGFLNQDMLSYSTDHPILDVAMGCSAVMELQKKMDEVIEAMEKDYKDSLMEELSSLLTKFEQMGGYDVQSKAEKVWRGLVLLRKIYQGR